MFSLAEFLGLGWGQDALHVTLALKGTTILAAAWVMAAMARWMGTAAATRHFLWSLGVAGTVALPVLEVVLPDWRLPANWAELHATQVAGAESAASEVKPAFVLFASTQVTEDFARSNVEDKVVGSEAPVLMQSIERAGIALPGDDPLTGTGLSWPIVIWFCGALLAMLPAAWAVGSLWLLALRSHVVSWGLAFELLQQNKARLGMARDVRLLVSPEREMPMTWGIWSATILLPEVAESWPAERLRVVLLHELAHVQRWDCLTQLVGQIARAVHWFNPLAWIAVQQLRALQERAADDVVLNAGCAAADYAEHLLEVSAGCFLKQRVGAVALAMARRRAIERRIVSILSAKENRMPISARMRSFVIVGAAAVLIAVAALRVGTVTADEAGQGGQAAVAGANQAVELAELRAKIAAQYVTPVDDQEIVRGAIKGMLGALHDPYSDYLTPAMLGDIERQLSGTLVGIGVQLEMREKQIRVITPLADSPALAAGIQAGDVILQIDGKATTGMELPDVIKLVAGQQGTAVRLKIGRSGQELDISVTRGPLKLATVRGFRPGTDKTWEYLLDGNRKIGYLQVAHFGAATPDEMREAIASLKQQGARGLILDLRFCPGGSLDAAVGSAKLFLDGGMTLSLYGRNGDMKPILADRGPPATDVPLVVLVSGQTASAAEVFVGALQDNQRAVVLGTRTVGKGSVQTLIKLAEGIGAIKLTTSQYRLPSGRNIDKGAGGAGFGIHPDAGYFVPLSRAQVKAILERQREREIVGRGPAGQPMDVAQEIQADPQLAAAVKTMTARLEGGAFVKVSELTAEQAERAQKREEIEKRRDAARKSLEEIEKELAGLAKGTD